MSKVIRKKLVIVGDGACGKTSLLTVFAHGEFPSGHVPTVFDSFVKDFEVDGQHIELALWDTAGQEDYDRLRPLSYPDSDVILISFAVDLPDSLDNITEKWLPEVKKHCPQVPFLLVACKRDLREDSHTIEELQKVNSMPVSYEEAAKVARSIKAYKYVECSSKSGDGVQDVFIHAVKATTETAGKKKKNNNDKCVLM
ncbi:GTP-binding protein Rho1 [Apophysomyces sp. BC1034]|nr:GTP-binding protein Rho1 [Apophysomyces sp. BC1015]KAG0174024.1 GTP-binding protein Rho1 [Apophysomyces sp. BC1021]KAG0185673.1 GTP-binding protein Rho1 [Apophysomyces sp. BC1034]